MGATAAAATAAITVGGAGERRRARERFARKVA
jgi:hypothetical protein